jgi:lipopolysaccharide/colanic/teichoic acid biosynthesis glycosyltransferase
MMARSVISANPINHRQTSRALRLLLGFPTEFQRSELAPASDLTYAKRLQPILHRFAERASCDPHGAASNCGLHRRATSALGRFAKRILDFLVASITILLLWPLMLMIAVAVRLESQGPAIYPSLPVGKRGMLFACYKFRTMIPGASLLRQRLLHLNQRRGPFFKMADDPRVTRPGRFLRKYSLDELPQLWNVLKGEMSLVGPRPHPLADVALYRPEHHSRLEVKPGLTGLWQVTARANPSFATCLQLDLAYIRKWSLLLDCRIFAKTIPEVLSGSGE